RVPRRFGRGQRPRFVGPCGDPRDRPPLLQVDEHGLLESPALLHQKALEIEDAVITWQLIVATEPVLLTVFGEPVGEQVVVAPVAHIPGGHPIEPIAVRPRVDERPVVALGDRGPTDHWRSISMPIVSRSPRRSGSSRNAV